MKRVCTAVALFSLILAGCFGGGESRSETACQEPYESDVLSLCLPSGWKALASSELQKRGLPAEVVAAFQGEEAISGQFPIVTVTSEALREALSTGDYSEASIASVETLPGYELVDRKRTEVSGEDSEIHIFHAQPTPSDPLRRFYQVSAVSNGIGYTFTAALPVSPPEEAQEQVLELLQSVSFAGAVP